MTTYIRNGVHATHCPNKNCSFNEDEGSKNKRNGSINILIFNDISKQCGVRLYVCVCMTHTHLYTYTWCAKQD